MIGQFGWKDQLVWSVSWTGELGSVAIQTVLSDLLSETFFWKTCYKLKLTEPMLSESAYE
jgi:hypothetical protein